MIQALIRLIRQRSLNEISVRDIAREAGVNHGLVHRYFGSKDNLVRAAAGRISDEIHQGYPGRRGMSAFTFRYLREHPEVVRVVAQACLDDQGDLLAAAGPDPERLAEIVAPVQEALGRAGFEGTVDPHVLNAVAISAILGWFLFSPLLYAGFGLAEDADAQVEGLLELLDALVAPEA